MILFRVAGGEQITAKQYGHAARKCALGHAGLE